MTLEEATIGILLASVLVNAIALQRLFKRRTLAGASLGLVGLIVMACGGTLLALLLSLEGYQALTREEVAATLRTTPLGEQVFLAELERPDGTHQAFQIEGDQVYVDARILKWKSWANLVGLHTGYQLDRIGGRYVAIDDEMEKNRSLFSLIEETRIDPFALRQEYAWLAPVVDAEYGSATFIAADQPSTFEVRVSTTGLLIRKTSTSAQRVSPR